MSVSIIQVNFRFKGLPYVVFDVFGKLYELPHCISKRSKLFREIIMYSNNGCLGYRINGKYYSKKKLNSLAYKSVENVKIYGSTKPPF